MSLSFDYRGLLRPYQEIELNLEDFEKFFVSSFDDNSTRHSLFSYYRKYLADFQTEVTQNFSQLINGSFVTNKRNPRDIDLVTLLDHTIVEKKYQILQSKFLNLGAENTTILTPMSYDYIRKIILSE